MPLPETHDATGPIHSRRWLLPFDAETLPVRAYDVIVFGSGIAGLTAALNAPKTARVALITKGRLSDSNTWLAQGGIAGAVGEADSVELHLADTLVVGQGLCDEAVVRAVVAEAPEALAALQARGMHFDEAADGNVALAREGGHSLPRVLHSGDSTGAAVQQALTDSLMASERVDVYEHRFLVDLVTSDGVCTGALVLDTETGELEGFSAGATVLATGGAGQMFRVTTNPLVATGDGVAAAWRAGARITDLEFMQFHPTALDHDEAPRFLVSEALRGEGALLLDCDGVRFMEGVHPLAELAPRDVVSREIERVMQRCGCDHVWLDARHLGGAYLSSRFPTIWQACADAGYDLSRDLLPVAPAAHYSIGGVQVDIDGHTSIPGLYATGEVAASGLHGANRLASNSLLEGLVFSRRISRVMAEANLAPRTWTQSGDSDSGGTRAAIDVRAALQAVAGSSLGMSRTAQGTATAVEAIAKLASELEVEATVASLEVANLLAVAGLLAYGAAAREESRGCHSRLDHPLRDDACWRGHIVLRRGERAQFVPLDIAHDSSREA